MTANHNARFLESVREALGARAVLTDEGDLASYGKDWTNFARPNPLAVALPKTTSEVSRLLKLCFDSEIAVVPSGGRTGLSGGAVAARGELVLSLSRMTALEPLNLTSQTVRVQAGAVNQAVQDHCAAHDLFWPVELGSKGSCEVGGNISTNAGGVRVIRYGHTRNWVQSLRVVLMGGEVLELNGNLEKNNTGYDFRHLVIGSEGTLAVVTEATLKLTKRTSDRDTLFFGLGGMDAVLELLRSARGEGFPLLAFECLTKPCLDAVRQARGLAAPLSHDSLYYVLMDVERPTGAAMGPRLEAWIEALFSGKKVLDGTLAQSALEGRKLWEFREGITESLAGRGTVYKNDLSLPISELESFTVALARGAKDWYGGACEIFFFGHIGDGNLHVNVLKPPSMDTTAFLGLCERANEPLFSLVRDHGGSIAAEHGIGLLKKPFLHYSRSKVEIELMRQIKKAFDPKGLLNPGKIFDLKGESVY